ncbi:MAG: SDR family NAD(P)-dependent oxidoreductase [Pseudomonadota bacterium]
MGLLDGKVIMITGAGNGIGRDCAIEAAALGAKVLVNDLGGRGDGRDEGSNAPAAEVVDIIRKNGGEAIANYSSVTDLSAVKQMVEQCLDEFGGLHAIMNPAGILRDGMFHKTSEEDFFDVVDVHLRGAYNVAKASIDHFRKQEDGNYVFFTSTGGLIGNFGQSNYAAAKMGVVGLSRILAMEGARKKVRSNAIAPFAWTRLVATIPVKDEESRQRVERFKTGMRAEQVAKFCIALCADKSSHVSGQLFSIRGNEIFLMSQPRPMRSIARGDGWTTEQIVDNAIPALENWFYDLEPSAKSFPGEPV